jgi:Riboflavin kinase
MHYSVNLCLWGNNFRASHVIDNFLCRLWNAYFLATGKAGLLVATMSNEIRPERPLIVGPSDPEAPFPVTLEGTVVKGYGRGSRELGIPTGRLHTCMLS